MLKQIKTKILSLISSRGFKRSLFFGGVVFIIMHFGFDTVFASGLEGDSENAVNSILAAVQYLVGISASLLGALTGIIAILLDPGFTNGTVFGISGYIKDVWIFMSNMVYLIFAGILIMISFANIIGKGDGELFELKKSLPRFVIGVLIVPFSWFIVQLMISIASILMVSVYTWPIETFPSNNTDFNTYLDNDIEWCNKWVINIQGNFNSGSTTDTGSGFLSCSEKPPGGTKQVKDILGLTNTNDKTNIGGILSIYTFGIMDIKATSDVLKGDLKELYTMGKLTAKVIFDILFILVYLVILIALFLALFIRVIMLWIYMMMSPLFGLFYFLGKGKGGSFAEKFNFKEFIALVMVPVYVAAALSFGLMFTFIIGAGLSSDTNGVYTNDTFDLGYTSIQITGTAGGEASKFFKNSIGIFGYLMIKIFSLAVLWMAVMAALKASAATKSIIEPIEKFGKQVGDLAKQSPMYIPIPGTSGVGMGGKNATFGALTGGLSQGLQEKMNQSTGTSQVRNKLFGDEQSKQLSKDLGNAIILPAGEAFNKMKDIFRNNDEARLFLEKERVAEGMKQAGIEGADRIRGAKDSKDFIKIATEINKDNANIAKGKQIYGRTVTEDEAASITGGSSSGGTASSIEETKKTGDSNTPSNQTDTFIINYKGVSGIVDDTNGGYEIKDIKAATASIKSDLTSHQGQIDTDKLIEELGIKIGVEEKDNIIKIIQELGNEEYFKDKEKDPKKLKEKVDKIITDKGVVANSQPPTPPSTQPTNPTSTE